MPYGQYVLAYISPYADVGDRERNYLGKAEYLVSGGDCGRMSSTGASGPYGGNPPNPYHPNQYSDWYTVTYKGETHSVFPTYYTIQMGSKPEYSDASILNAKFDEVYSSGGIYELITHPANFAASASFVQTHLNYISGRTDCWYAPLGCIYGAYRYVALFVQHSQVS
jgi:hypothetical protein